VKALALSRRRSSSCWVRCIWHGGGDDCGDDRGGGGRV